MPDEPIILKLQVEGGEESAVQVSRVGDEVEHVDRKARDAEKGLGMFGRGLSGLRGAFSYAMGVGGFAGLAFGIGDAVKNAVKFQDVTRQLSTSLKAVGDRVRPATKELTEYADSLSLHGGFAPTDTITGLTALVRVTGSALGAEKAMTMATNVARGAHVSLSRAVRAVTMAEQGRATGLARLGINIVPVTTATQKLAAAAGTATPAQKAAAKAADLHSTSLLALTAIQKKFAGSTATYSHTAAGATENLSHALDIVGEKVGLLITPYITKAATAMSGFVDQFEKGTGTAGQLKGVLEVVGRDLSSVWHWVSQNRSMMLELGAAVLMGVAAWRAFLIIQKVIGFVTVAITLFKALRGATLGEEVAQMGLNAAFLANPIGIVIIAIGALVAAFIVAYNKVAWFRNLVNAVWSWMKTEVVNVVHWVGAHWKLLAEILGGPFIGLGVFIATHFNGVKSIIQGVLNWVIGAVNVVIRAIDSIHVKIPKILGFGGGTIGFNISQIAPVSLGGGGGGHTASTTGVGMGHRALGGYVYGQGKRDDVPSYLKPGEYVATDSMVGDVGRPAMDSWRSGGDPPGGSTDDMALALQMALQGLGVFMDGQLVGTVLTRQGLNARAMR